MTDQGNSNPNLRHHDPETDALINQLDALGAQDNAAPDAGFEQRIMDSISKQIAPAPLPISTPLNQETHAHHFPSRPIGIAAAFVLVAGVTLLLWNSTRTSMLNTNGQPSTQPTLVSLEESFEALYELPDFAVDLDSDLAELDLLTDEMHTELTLPSVLLELSDSSLTEGSL